MLPDLKGISDKGAAGVKQKPRPETREAMIILRLYECGRTEVGCRYFLEGMTMFRGESWEISPGRGRNKHQDAVFWGDFSCFSQEKRDKKGRGPGEKGRRA